MFKIIQYRNKCIGCGICQELQPELWRMSKKDGKATLLKGIEKKGIFSIQIHPSQEGKSKEVARSCPVKIIRL